MDHIDKLKNGATILLGSLMLALLWVLELRGAYLQFAIFPAAVLIGVLVAWVRTRGSKMVFKRALFAAALVGPVAALVYYVVIAGILISQTKLEVLFDRRSTFLMLTSAVLLTLCSASGGLMVASISKRRTRKKEMDSQELDASSDIKYPRSSG